jgi:hypothetical protein
MISTLVALPYKIARAPLSLVDSTLSPRLPETSAPRTTLDLVIGSTDRLAGALLRDEGLARRGEERLERSDTLRKAAKLEHEADAKLKQAEHAAASGHQEAQRKRQAAEDRVDESLQVADVIEADDKREAKAEAKKEAAAEKRAADRKAEASTSAIEKRKQRVTAAAEAKQKAGQRQAKSMFDEAREAERDATQSRSDAAQLAHLVETKKQQRKED